MPNRILSQQVLLPELELEKFYRHKLTMFSHARKRCPFEVCPKCAAPSSVGYDKRIVEVKDAPLRNTAVTLVLTKRRFYCKTCKKPFTEPVSARKAWFKTPKRRESDSSRAGYERAGPQFATNSEGTYQHRRPNETSRSVVASRNGKPNH